MAKPGNCRYGQPDLPYRGTARYWRLGSRGRVPAARETVTRPYSGPVRPGDRPGSRSADAGQRAGAAAEPDDLAQQARPAGQRCDPGGDGLGAPEPAVTGPGEQGQPPVLPARMRLAAARVGLAARSATVGAARRLPLAGMRPAPVVAAGDADRRADTARGVFARLTVLPAIAVVAWLLPGLPLLLAGDFTPFPALLISVPLAVVFAVFGLRSVPVSWPQLFPGPPLRRGRASWWGTVGTVVVAVGFTAWQLVENSPALVVNRAPAVYLQVGYWIAQHGSLPIPQSAGAFGGAQPGLGFSSIGFFAHGASVVPAVTPGLPMLLAGAFWMNGISAAAGLSPVLGGLAVLAFGGLVARLAGLPWAPAGALVLALTLPEQYTSRSAFSETLVQVLLFGGLSLVIDALTVRAARPGPARPADPAAPPVRWRWTAPSTWAGWIDRPRPPAGLASLAPERVLAGLGGLALGLTVLADVGSLAFLLAVIPFAGALAAARKPAAVPFCCGVVLGTGAGLAGGYLLARPYLASIGTTMELVGIAAAWLIALTLAVVQLLRAPRVRAFVRRILARRPLRWLPEAGAAAAVAAMIGLAVRPYLQVVRGRSSPAVQHYVGYLQRVQHLPIDPGRLYAEDTLYWVIWYVGVPAVLLGGFGLALLARRSLRALLTWSDPSGACRNWALPLIVIGFGSAVVLWHPGIVPDQPWASRRLVPVVIPGLILCATWAAAWLTGLARERGAGPVTASVVALFCVGALALPTVTTTFGVDLSHTGRGGGLQPSASGMALRQTSAGEISALRGLCASIPGDSAVLIVDRRVAERFTQVIRGICGVPAAWMVGRSEPAVDNVLANIQRQGRRPVLLAGSRAELAALGRTPVKVLDLRTAQDPQELAQPPTSLLPAHYVIWMATGSSAISGA
jgi:hypothetical protein